MESWHQLYTCIGTCGVKGESAVCCEDFCVVCVSGFALVAAHQAMISLCYMASYS